MVLAFSPNATDSWLPCGEAGTAAFDESTESQGVSPFGKRAEWTSEKMPPDRALASDVTIVNARTDWINSAHRRLAQISRLADGWDSFTAEAPSSAAISRSRFILEGLAENDLKPTSIDPSAEGGVCISFRRGDNYADFECFNTGEILAITSRGPGTASVWRLNLTGGDLELAAKNIRRFLGR